MLAPYFVRIIAEIIFFMTIKNKHKNGKKRIEIWLDDSELKGLSKCAKADAQSEKPKVYIEYLVKKRLLKLK